MLELEKEKNIIKQLEDEAIAMSAANKLKLEEKDGGEKPGDEEDH